MNFTTCATLDGPWPTARPPGVPAHRPAASAPGSFGPGTVEGVSAPATCPKVVSPARPQACPRPWVTAARTRAPQRPWVTAARTRASQRPWVWFAQRPWVWFAASWFANAAARTRAFQRPWVWLSRIPFLLLACTQHPHPTTTPSPQPLPPPLFSGPAALNHLHTLLSHPRTLGHPARTESITHLTNQLSTRGATQVEHHPFQATDPTTGTRYELTNILGHIRPNATRRYILATHFDTRPWADEEPDPQAHTQPVPGANDGTSGVAIILELLPLLAKHLPHEVGLTVILFDGEELGHAGDTNGYCMGSRHLATVVSTDPPAWFTHSEFGIVLDMVGDRDLHLPIEPTSFAHAPALVRDLWAVAAQRGHTQFEDRLRSVGILDDHAFLTQAGVPSILLIDKEYPPWHTRQDTFDKVSAASLGAVGDTVLHTLLEHAARPRTTPSPTE